jgi:hypothetical protein
MKCQNTECHCTTFNQKFCKFYRPDKKKKSSGISKVRKPTGEMEVFQKLWEERPHTCFVSGNQLEFSHYICFHILGKGAYPKYRLNPDNIIFVSREYHDDWHSMTKPELIKKDCDWQKVFDIYDTLKERYIREAKAELSVYLQLVQKEDQQE